MLTDERVYSYFRATDRPDDTVRACVLWDWDADAAAPATGGEDSRVVLWGAAGGAGGGDGSSGGGKAARSESAETEYHDRGRRRHSPY